MNPDIRPGTVVYEFFVEKRGGSNSDTFVGDEGLIFYDPTRGDLRISDDVTPGGIPLLQKLLEGAAANTTSNTAAGGGAGGGGGLPGANTTVYNYTAMESNGVINYGNVKQGFQTTDHFGWILLDGRAVATLTATQQSIAARLGWTTNIPDATGRIGKMTGQTPGTAGGILNNQIYITQPQLPNVNLVGTTDGIGHEDHAGATLGYSGKWLYNSSGNFTRNVTVQLNPVTQNPTNVENAYIALNTFAYLGL